MPEIRVRNRRGEFVLAVPEPLHGLLKQCGCGRRFWSLADYRGHYALVHILGLEES